MEPARDSIPLRGRGPQQRAPSRAALGRRRRRAAWLNRLWLWGSWLAAWRRVPAQPDDVQRQSFRQQTRGMGVRMTERLRDRLRPAWLRLRRDDDEADDVRPANDGPDQLERWSS